ncbi:hypothetical protein [Vibrio rotiferianus]|uniref:hypothetical protein n=1 Tax=Vibrio rotiferianus TaxID=190895 RepID=UPI003909CF25
MELTIFVASVVLGAALLGLLSRHRKRIEHFFKIAGIFKFLLFLVLSVAFLGFSLESNNGYSSIVLPTLLGLFLNGIVFTVFIDYQRERARELDLLEKVDLLDEVVGNTVYYFQNLSGVDFTQYRGISKSLHSVSYETTVRIREHYKSPLNKQRSMETKDFYPTLSKILARHYDIYKALLPVTLNADKELARNWTEVTFSLERLSRMLKEVSNQEMTQHDLDMVVDICSIEIVSFFDSVINFYDYKNSKKEYILG